MDMSSMDSGMDNSTTASSMMTSFTTQLGASNLWFTNWTPTAVGSTFGACLGLFFLAIFSRLLATVSASAEAAWSQREALVRSAALLRLQPEPSSLSIDGDSKTSSSSDAPPPPPTHIPALGRAPPFLLAVDVPRGVLFSFGAFVQYLLMLGVMTFNAWFFIAILLGLGVGETAFGRFAVRGTSNMVH